MKFSISEKGSLRKVPVVLELLEETLQKQVSCFYLHIACIFDHFITIDTWYTNSAHFRHRFNGVQRGPEFKKFESWQQKQIQYLKVRMNDDIDLSVVLGSLDAK